MNKLSKISFAALGGITVLMLAAPADAAIQRSQFSASVDELRRYCHRIEEDFWWTKRRYGCGDKITCMGGSCVKIVKKQPPTRQPPTRRLIIRDGGGESGHENGNPGGNGGGNPGGRGSNSAAGGPN